MRINEAIALLKQVDAQQLLTNLIEQINKDAHLSGLETRLEKTLSSEELVVELYHFLLQLISYDFGSYLNFLYRVDIPEKTLRSITDIEPKLIVKQVTLLVLKREWQKVSLRNKTQ